MKLFRLFLLLCMSLIILLMAGCPGLHDTKRKLAWRHYHDAPGEETRREIDEARRLNNREIVVFEVVMVGIFGLFLVAFIRAGKRR
jgi:hypothetical protein